MFPIDVVIVAGARTPMTRYAAIFKDTSAIELGACAAREAIRRRVWTQPSSGTRSSPM